MPGCERCGVVKATAEMRRVRGSGGTAFVCKDAGSCHQRERLQRAEARGANLSRKNQRRIEIANLQLTAVKESVSDAVWNSAAMAHVRESWNHLQPKGEK